METSLEDSSLREEDSDPKRGPRVVVVGAGFAGVGAVGALRAGGIHDVTLLEASERPGGRVKTVVLENGFIELGAQFLHGKNEVYEIAEREGLLADEDPEESNLPDTLLQFREFVFRTSDGKNVDAQIVNNNLQALENLQAEANGTIQHESVSDVGVSVGQFFKSKYQNVRKNMMGPDHLKTAMFRWFENWGCQDSGGPVDQLSLPGNHQYVFYPGSGIRETTTGMEAVFQSLLRDSVPQDCLHLNKAVKAIHWAESDTADVTEAQDDVLGVYTKGTYGLNNNLIIGENFELSKPSELILGDEYRTKPSHDVDVLVDDVGEKKDPAKEEDSNDAADDNEADDSDVGRTKPDYKVRIECVDGEVFYADHVIATPSVGFLADNPKFFQPQLPPLHQEAISSTGFGNVAKMCLFWKEGEITSLKSRPAQASEKAADWQRRLLGGDMYGMIPLWLPEYNVQLKSAKHSTKMSNGRHWYQEVSIVNIIETHEYALVAWIGGQAAIVMESLPESEVKDVLHELLALFLDKPDLPVPYRLIRTQWHSNPYTRGTYSYLATHVPLELQEVLRQPLPSLKNPVVQLAGEACSKHYYSTAHGALRSGQDAARAILRHHKMAQQ